MDLKDPRVHFIKFPTCRVEIKKKIIKGIIFLKKPISQFEKTMMEGASLF